MIFLSLSLAGTKGQEALLSATSLDSEISAAAVARAKAPTKGLQIGPVQLELSASANTTFDDNINSARTSPESDLLTRAGLDLSLDWPLTDRSTLNFGSGISYVHYLRYTSNNGLEVSPDSALTYAISLDEVTLTFYDQLSYTREVKTQASLANVTVLPQLNNVAGFRTEWAPDKWTFQAGYSHAIDDASLSYLNSSSEYFFGRAGRVVAAQTQFGVEASASLTRYDIASQADNDSISVGGYAEWQVRPFLNVTFRGGPVFNKYYYPASRGGGTSQLNSYYLTFDVQHQITDYLSQSLQIERSVQAGSTQGSDYVEQLTGSYALSYNLTQAITLSASVTVEDGTQPYASYFYYQGIAIPGNTTIENYQRYGAGLQASWQLTDRFSARAGYNHWQRDSNQAERNYKENTFSFGFNYTF